MFRLQGVEIYFTLSMVLVAGFLLLGVSGHASVVVGVDIPFWHSPHHHETSMHHIMFSSPLKAYL